MSDVHQPLEVTAHLEGGIAWAGPWGIALDGILAGELHHQHRATHGEHIPLVDDPNPSDLSLPLARCTLDPADWHWAATTAYPTGALEELPDVRWWSARVDHQHLEHLADTLPTNIREREGRYRARWMPLLVTVCAAVSWRCVGDLTAITDLVTPIVAIGKKRAAGHGHVTTWQITPRPDLTPWDAAHLHPDDTLGRPTPPRCLTGHHVRDGGVGAAGIRPPYTHPARQRHLHLPHPTTT